MGAGNSKLEFRNSKEAQRTKAKARFQESWRPRVNPARREPSKVLDLLRVSGFEIRVSAAPGRYSAAAVAAGAAAAAFLAGALAFGAATGFALTAGFFEASLRAKYAARRFRLITLLYCLPIEGD